MGHALIASIQKDAVRTRRNSRRKEMEIEIKGHYIDILISIPAWHAGLGQVMIQGWIWETP